MFSLSSAKYLKVFEIPEISCEPQWEVFLEVNIYEWTKMCNEWSIWTFFIFSV